MKILITVFALLVSISAQTQETYGLNKKSLTTPTFVDIDGDGDLDAFGVITGMSAGQNFFHENIGTKESPEFSEAQMTPFGLSKSSLSSPSFVDIDNDGDLDAFGVSTGMSAGKPFYIENIGTATTPAFSEVVYNPFGILRKSLSAMTFVDIDNDGDLDAYGVETGMSAGRIFFYENTGSKEEPVFSNVKSNPHGLLRRSLTAPTFHDIDGDGDLDILAVETGMSAGKVFFCENTGLKEEPAFNAPVSNPFGLTKKSLASPALVDLNSDGVIEVVCVETGMSAGNIYSAILSK